MDFQFEQYKLRAQRLEDDDDEEEEEEKKARKPEAEEKEPGLRIEEKILETRTILLFGEISQKSAREVCQKLILLSALNSDPIKLIINSQGGHVEAGDTIHDMITFVKPKVKILGTGWVASAGALIYVSVPVEQRYSLLNTRYMLHQPSGGVGGQASDISIEAQEILKMRDRLNNLFAKQTGQPVERIEKDTDRNFWMSAEEAKAYGLVGKIITSQADY
jgi:ATP-dependent Clp protease, protease subunit